MDFQIKPEIFEKLEAIAEQNAESPWLPKTVNDVLENIVNQAYDDAFPALFTVKCLETFCLDGEELWLEGETYECRLESDGIVWADSTREGRFSAAIDADDLNDYFVVLNADAKTIDRVKSSLTTHNEYYNSFKRFIEGDKTEDIERD